MLNSQSFNTSPRRYITFGLIVIAIFFGGFGSWATLAKMEGAIIAPGLIKVERNRKEVQHLEGGIVQKVRIRNGERVEKGQTLLSLKSASVSSNVDMLTGQMDAMFSSKARLTAERDLKSEIIWPENLARKNKSSKVQDLIHAETQIFLSRRKSLKGQTQLLNAQALQIQEQIKGLQEQNISEVAIIRALDEELLAKRELLKEHYLGKPQVLSLERELASHQGRKSALKSEIAQLKERTTETRVRINDLKTQYIERAVNQLSEVQTKLFELEERIRPIIDAEKRLNVLAPASGVVVDLQVFSEGEVVRPGESLMQIVPEKEPLIVECNVRPVDIAKVHVGQLARLELNAFNRREIMPVDGRVTYVSADSIIERTPYGEQRVYVIHAEIERDQVSTQDITLTPGMPVTVFLKTGERTFLDYIMEPLVENFRQALKE